MKLHGIAEKTVGLKTLKKKQAAALSAIGDPASFERALEGLGITLKQIWRYPDHHFFTPLELSSARQAAGELPIITTFKDFLRFPADWQQLLGGNLLTHATHSRELRYVGSLAAHYNTEKKIPDINVAGLLPPCIADKLSASKNSFACAIVNAVAWQMFLTPADSLPSRTDRASALSL